MKLEIGTKIRTGGKFYEITEIYLFSYRSPENLTTYVTISPYEHSDELYVVRLSQLREDLADGTIKIVGSKLDLEGTEVI